MSDNSLSTNSMSRNSLSEHSVSTNSMSCHSMSMNSSAISEDSMAQRASQKEQTRRRIVDRAARLVARRGFARVSTVDVARQANISHGAVFSHFRTRDQLMLEVAAKLGRALTDRLHALASSEASLRDVLAAHVQGIEEQEELYRHLLVERPFLPARFRVTWAGIQSAISQHLLRALEREVAARRIRKLPHHLVF